MYYRVQYNTVQYSTVRTVQYSTGHDVTQQVTSMTVRVVGVGSAAEWDNIDLFIVRLIN